MLSVTAVNLDQYIVVNEERILKCGGDQEFLMSLLKEFIETYGDAPRKLRESLPRGEKEKALQLLHSIKGGSGNIGLEQIAAVTKSLEKALQDQQVCLTNDLVNTFEEAIENLYGYLQAKG